MRTWLKFSGGSTYLLAINWLAQDGSPASLAGATLTGQLFACREHMTAGENAIATLAHTQSGASGSTLVFAPANTAAWKAPAAPWWRAAATLADGTVIVLYGCLWLTPFVPAPYLASDDVLVEAAATMSVATLTVSAPINLSLVTGWVGGTSTDLDAVATAAYSDGTIVLLSIGQTSQLWQLLPAATTGPATGSAPYEVVEPTDYNATTNARRWKLL